MSHVTDLQLLPGEGVLYSTTRYDGQITAWNFAGTGLSTFAAMPYRQAALAGTAPQLHLITAENSPALVYGGGVTAPMRVVSLGPSGTFGATDNLGVLSGLTGDLVHTVSLRLANGSTAVYGGIDGAAGVGVLRLDSGGGLQGSAVTTSSAAAHAGAVCAMAIARIGSTDYVFSACQQSPGVTAWRADPAGNLTAVANLGADEGLWVSIPTALVSTTLAGVNYLVMAAAGSGSLSVIRVAANGGMVVTDHVLDDGESRFAGVTALELVETGGRSYLIVGGSDDGISVYQLLPGGRLLATAHMADTTTTSLANVSAIAAAARDGGIDIFVASSVEAGLTRLLLDSGIPGSILAAPAGGGSLTGTAHNDILTGGAGADTLLGGAGDDILSDGAGSDVMTGGTGADIFVLSADGVTDTITDFAMGIDRLDLSGWGMLRSVAQLTLASTATGMRISFGNEVLIVHSDYGGPLNPLLLQNSDVLNLTRLAIVAAEPTDPHRGGDGPDTLTGGNGNDSLFGGAGDDVLYGGAGADRLDGGTGADTMSGGLGNDRYIVDSLRDVIAAEIGYSQGGGIDTVESWVDFQLGNNLEILRLQGNDHLRGTGSWAPEALVGNAGNNVLDGSRGFDQINGKSGNDTLVGGQGLDWLVGETGADVFIYREAADSGIGQANRDLINGFEHGIDRIDLSAIDANPLLAGDQAFHFIGSAPFSGTGIPQVRSWTWGTTFVLTEIDIGGDGHADMQIFIMQTDHMLAGDFIL